MNNQNVLIYPSISQTRETFALEGTMSESDTRSSSVQDQHPWLTLLMLSVALQSQAAIFQSPLIIYDNVKRYIPHLFVLFTIPREFPSFWSCEVIEATEDKLFSNVEAL